MFQVPDTPTLKRLSGIRDHEGMAGLADYGMHLQSTVREVAGPALRRVGLVRRGVDLQVVRKTVVRATRLRGRSRANLQVCRDPGKAEALRYTRPEERRNSRRSQACSASSVALISAAQSPGAERKPDLAHVPTLVDANSRVIDSQPIAVPLPGSRPLQHWESI